MNRRQTPAFTATCQECRVDTAIESPNELVEFYRRHYRRTGHDIVLSRAALEFDVPSTGDIVAVVAALEARYEAGVPIGIVVAAMSERGRSVGETLERIYEVRMTGALYEPRDDYLATV